MPDSTPSNVTRTALVVLAVIAVGAALYWLADILTPPALALFMAIVIDGFARVLRRRLPWMPDRAALPVAIVLSILLFGGSVYVVAENLTSLAGKLVTYAPQLHARVDQIARLIGVAEPPSLEELIARLDLSRYIGDIARGFQGFVSDAVFILIYLGFIIAARHAFERKIVGLAHNRAERREAVEAFLHIRDGVEQYLWVQTVTGLMIAVGSWIAMVAVGLDNAVFWAFLIFIASFIPIVGGAVGVILPPLFALIQFETYWQAIALLAALQVIQFVVGSFVLPRMQGRSLNIDPVVVLLALAFWGKIWGVAGAFLSTPLTVMAMVILVQFEGTRWAAILLSADGDPDKLRDRKPARSPDEPPPDRRRRAGGGT